MLVRFVVGVDEGRVGDGLVVVSVVVLLLGVGIGGGLDKVAEHFRTV